MYAYKMVTQQNNALCKVNIQHYNKLLSINMISSAENIIIKIQRVIVTK